MSVAHIVLILFLVSVSVANLDFFPNLQAIQDSQNNQTKEKIDLVIELAIFCDREFSSRFQHDSHKLEQYWKALMYDTHLRFQTLSSFNISFRVTTLHSLAPDEEQDLLIGQGNTYSFENTLDRFESLLYLNLNHLPSFDISILVLGSNQVDANGYDVYTSGESICVGRDDIQLKWKSNILLALTLPLSETLAENIARVIGIPSDNDQPYWEFCYPTLNPGRDCCIHGNTRKFPETSPHYFSRCTNQFLLAMMPLLKASENFCLDVKTAEKNPIIDTERLFQNPSQVPAYTYEEQCQILTNDKDAIVFVESLAPCLLPRCKSIWKSQHFAFTPFDGSVCGKYGKGRCLRFECMEPHVYLVNVATEKCLVSEQSQFGVYDKPVLKPCSEVPFDVMLGLKIKEDEIFRLTMLYSTDDGPGFKHLKLGENSKMELQATFDPNLKDVRTNWILNRLKDSDWQEFVLMHGVTNLCAKAGDNGRDLNFTKDCSGYDLKSRWKFVKVNEFNPDDLYSANFVYGYFLEKYYSWIFILLGVILMMLFVYLVVWWKYIKPKAEMDQKLKIKKGTACHTFVRGKKVKTKKVKIL